MNKRRISILKGNDADGRTKKRESRANFEIEECGNINSRCPKMKKTVCSSSPEKHDLSQEIDRISRSSLFKNLFTNKSKRRLTRIISPIDLNDKPSNSVIDLNKKKNSFFKKVEELTTKSSYSPQKNIKKLSKSHFSEILSNLKKYGFVLNNPLSIFGSEIRVFKSVIIQ